MDYQVEQSSPVATKVNVTVPSEEVDGALTASAAIYARGADIKGFRKGHVPFSVIEQRYKKQIQTEATNELVGVHINEILGALNKKPLGGIDVDAELIDRGQGFSYSFSFEHAPEFTLPAMDNLEVEEEQAEADTNEVDQVIERMRGNFAELTTITETRTPKDGDVAVVSFEASENGTPMPGMRAENFQLELGTGQALVDFEAIVKTLTKGQEDTKPVSFPADFLNTDLAGKTVDMHVILTAIKEKKLPPVDDELAKKAGFESLEKLKKTVADSYVRSRQELFTAAAQKKLLDGMLDPMDIPLPPRFVEDTLQRLVEDHVDRLERYGKSLESTGKTLDGLRAELAPVADSTVKSQLFLMAVAGREGFTVTPQEVDGHISLLAQRAGQDPRVVRQAYERQNLLGAVADKLLCDKAMNFLYSRAKVTKIPAKAVEA